MPRPFVALALFAPLALAAADSPVRWERLAFPFPETVWAVAHADLDRNNRMDLVAIAETRVFAISDLIVARRQHTLVDLIDGKLLHGASADLNGDGHLDIVIGRQVSPWIAHRSALEKNSALPASAPAPAAPSPPAGPDFTLGWLENTGRLRESLPLHIVDRELHGIHGVWAGDIDGDNRADIAATSFAGPAFPDSVAWFQQQPPPPHSAETNSKTPPVFTRHLIVNRGPDLRPHYLDALDLNGDGRRELLLGAPRGNSFTLWSAVSGPAHDAAWQRQLIAEQKGATNAVFADLDRDGRPDIVAANGHGRGVLWFRSPDWKPEPIDPDYPNVHALTSGDYDGDGDTDIAAASFSEKTVRWYVNDGSGNFTRHDVDTGNSQESYDLKTADMNADGRPDLLLAGRHSKNAVVYLNFYPSPAIEPAIPSATLATPHRVEILAQNLRVPWSLDFLPDGRLLVAERPGRIRVIDPQRGLLPAPALQLDTPLRTTSGLFSVVAHPDFAKNHFVYLAHTVHGPDGTTPHLQVTRYRENSNQLVEPRIILNGIRTSWAHHGGRLRFGPDRHLYLTTGDANQTRLAQQLDQLQGKILRFTEDGAVPPDNPFLQTPGALPLIYAYGHRNAQGLAFDPATGSLWETEHGDRARDEINVIRRGQNSGWPVITSLQATPDMEPPRLSLFMPPSAAPGGIAVYRSTVFPELDGHLLVGLMQTERLLATRIGPGDTLSEPRAYFEKQLGRIREVAVGPDGFVYLSTSVWDGVAMNKWESPAPFDYVVRIVPATHPRSPQFPELDLAESRRRLDAALIPGGGGLSDNRDELIAAHCAACHGPRLQGAINGSLLDGRWEFARGGTPEAIAAVITNGLPERGMLPFKGTLTEEEIRSLVRYIRANEKLP